MSEHECRFGEMSPVKRPVGSASLAYSIRLRRSLLCTSSLNCYLSPGEEHDRMASLAKMYWR